MTTPAARLVATAAAAVARQRTLTATVTVTATATATAAASTLAVAAAAVGAQAAASTPAPAPASTPKRRIVIEPDIPDVAVPDETLPQYLWRKSAHISKHPCITCSVTKRSLTFSETRSASRRWAQALLGPLQMRPGDMIALLLPNMPEYLPAVHGSLMAGLRVTMANPLYTAEELRRQFGDAGARLVVTAPPMAAKVREAMGPAVPIVVVAPDAGAGDQLPQGAVRWQEVLDSAKDVDVALPKGDPDAVAAVPYSSGTTGLPKGVMLTHRNLVSNLAMLDVPNFKVTVPTTDENQDILLTVLPFFHIYGFNGVLNLGVAYELHTVSMPVFTPKDYVEALVEFKPTMLAVVPSLLQFLALHPIVTKEMLASVRIVVSGAAAATQAVITKFREKIQRDDIVVSQGYGMTESSPVTFLGPKNKPRDKEVAVGQLLPSTRARIVRPDGHDAGPGEHGELLVTGPQIMKGYLGNEQATRETVDEEGWLHTGDVGFYDEQKYFYIVDRTKELIKVKGNQVSPTELENLIMELPEVADVAVIGIPDDRSDELPRAFVVLHPNTTLSEEQIQKYVEPKVVKYKRLAGGVIFLDKIPRNPSGKIIRSELKAWKPSEK